jgi:hypothetical protein
MGQRGHPTDGIEVGDIPTTFGDAQAVNPTPNRRRLAIVGVLLLLTAAPACGDSGASSAAPPAPTPSPSPAPTAAEDLTFTGALSGRMTSASAGDAFSCAAAGGSFVAGPILGDVVGIQVEMNITIVGFTGPRSYAPGGVSFDTVTDHYYPATGATGTIMVAPGLQSGTVDIALAMNGDASHAVAHVTGSWRCPPG